MAQSRKASALVAIALISACSSAPSGTTRQLVAGAPVETFMHTGFAAGPALFSDASGAVIEERRYEPFGAAIDARVRSGEGYVVGAPDVVARDLDARNKRVDAPTGWSDHGARWFAPRTARWTSTDPPVDGPDAKFMAAPWALHPYQYVEQNPVAFWDPDGRDPVRIASPRDFTPPMVRDIQHDLDPPVIAQRIAEGLEHAQFPKDDVFEALDTGLTFVAEEGLSWVANRNPITRIARYVFETTDAGACSTRTCAEAQNKGGSAGIQSFSIAVPGRLNRMGSDPRAGAPHSTWKRDTNGRLTNHEEWDADGNPVKRVDITGKAHDGIATPHTHEYGPPNVNPATGKAYPGNEVNVRPSSKDELPDP